MSTGFCYDGWTRSDNNSEEVAYFLQRVQALRCTGSAALDLAAVACGRSDAHWERGLAPYDVAAGILLVREARGRVSVAADPMRCSATKSGGDPAVHAEMVQYLRGRHKPRGG